MLWQAGDNGAVSCRPTTRHQDSQILGQPLHNSRQTTAGHSTTVHGRRHRIDWKPEDEAIESVSRGESDVKQIRYNSANKQ